MSSLQRVETTTTLEAYKSLQRDSVDEPLGVADWPRMASPPNNL